MGNCCTSSEPNIKVEFAIKLPNGQDYIWYDNETQKFIHDPDINTWIQNRYNLSYLKNWVVYNDDISKIAEKHTSYGHCKGIVTWNHMKIGWLCHSVPNFPRNFKGNTISVLEKSEYIYAQSFQYIEIPYTDKMLEDILMQVHYMNANIYNESYTEEYMHLKNKPSPKINKINLLKITDDIIHVAKNHNVKMDIYSDYIAKNSPENWYIQTWKRGHHINSINMKIHDITQLQFNDNKWSSTMDHSKWGVSHNEYYLIGDLNRMTSQYDRGGGSFICRNIKLANALNKLIVLE